MSTTTRWLDKLEKRFGRLAVPNVTAGLICGQVLIYLVAQSRPEVLANAALIPNLVLQGEPWRLVTFLFMPPTTNLLFAFFFWYLFYLMGTALEHQWGAFRYNLFLSIGFVATVAVAFLLPETRTQPTSNLFVQATVFLAFAHLFPDFVLHLFFILPIKIKWLALVAWLGYAYTFVIGLTQGDWAFCLIVFASIGNFVLFFGEDLVNRLRSGRRRRAWEVRQKREKDQPRHRCLVCGITNLTHPKMQFRYCTKCVGQCGYCTEHIHNHEHVTERSEAPSAD